MNTTNHHHHRRTLWTFQTPTGSRCRCIARANTRSEARAKIKLLFGLKRVPDDWRLYSLPSSYVVRRPERVI